MTHAPDETDEDPNAQPGDETRIVPFSAEVLNSPALEGRVALRKLASLPWIKEHGSSSLRKAERGGAGVKKQLAHERVAHEFGWGYEAEFATRVLYGRIQSEGDCPAITETFWHFDRLQALNVFPEDVFEAKYLHVDVGKPTARQGTGIIVRQTSAPWVPRGHLLFAFIALFNPTTGDFEPAQNPF